MLNLPTPHGDKLRALAQNKKLPVEDRPRVEQAVARYEEWLKQLREVRDTYEKVVASMVSLLAETHIAYVAAECKTNLDKTMFQEAAATALDVKTAIPGAKYYLLCEWLDMTPISASTTAIDEIIILHKAKRLPSNIRVQFNTAAGRQRNRRVFTEYLEANPFSAETFSRFLNHIRKLVSDDTEDDVLTRGYF